MTIISLVHLPNLRIGNSTIPPVAFNLLPQKITQEIDTLQIPLPKMLVISGDVVFSSTEILFNRAYQIIQSCMRTLDYPRLSIVPGDLDLTPADISAVSLIIKSLRSHPQSSKDNLELLLKRESLYRSLDSRLRGMDCVKNPFQPTIIHEILSNLSVAILEIDSALFSVGDSSDKGKLIVGDEHYIVNLMSTQFTSDLNIAVLHHHYTWLSQEQPFVLDALNKHCDLFFYSHALILSSQDRKEQRISFNEGATCHVSRHREQFWVER